MTRIESVQVFRWLWVAWEENDPGARNSVSAGLTKDSAWARCLGKLLTDG